MSTYRLNSDEQLVALMHFGDEQALGELHGRYYGLLYRHALRRLDDREEVRDLLQDLFVYLWNNRETLKFNSSVRSYLYTATRNRILNIYKHRQVRSDYLESLREFISEGTFVIEENLRSKELIALVEKEVAKLPSQMKLIFEMSRNQDLSHKEIAEILNISPLTVKKQVQNSLRILKVKLGSSLFTLLF